MEVIDWEVPPTSSDHLPLQGRHSLTPTRGMRDREEPPPKPQTQPEWCPCMKVKMVVATSGHRGGPQRFLFLSPTKRRTDRHYVPDCSRLPPTVPEHCLRRTSWSTRAKPRVIVLIRATLPAQSPSPEAGVSPRLLVPPTKRDGHTTDPRLRPLDMIRNSRPLGLRNYRVPSRWGSPGREWKGPHACYLYGQKRFLESARTMRGSCPPEKRLGSSNSASPVSTLSLSARDMVDPETLLILNRIKCASIIIVTLCPCLIRRPNQNKAVAPYNLIAGSDKIRAISTCRCPQCGCGPDVPDGDLSFRVSRYPQWESPPLAWEGNHPRLGSSLLAGICAAPSSERFNSAPLAPRLNQPTAVLRAIISIVPPGRSPACSNKILFRMSSWTLAVRYPRDRMNELAVIVGPKDPSCVPEVERENPTQRVSRLRATSSEGGPPLRRSGPFCTAASRGQGDPCGPSPVSNPTGLSFRWWCRR